MSFTAVILCVIIASVAVYFIFGRKNKFPLQMENEAKRFAKLLISEIRLFENYKVERGLKNNNLYESLKDEIEAARKKYKKSFPYTEFASFFDSALVEVLADGDKSKLGIVSTSLNK